MSIWVPEEGTPLWLAEIAAMLRRAWYRGKKALCSCPGCLNEYPRWWASGMCYECSTENCEHEDGTT